MKMLGSIDGKRIDVHMLTLEFILLSMLLKFSFWNHKLDAVVACMHETKIGNGVY